MAILRIKAVKATAEVAGLVRDVGYDDETKRLWIEALNADEAMELLKHLGRATKQLTMGATPNEEAVVEKLTTQGSDEGAKTTTGDEPVEPPQTTVAKKRRSRKKKAEPETEAAGSETKAEPAKKAKAPRAPVKSATVQDDIEGDETPEPVEATTTESASDDVPDNGAGGNGAEVSSELLGAKKLRDIVSILYDEGFKTQEAMVEKCVAVAPKLPVLKRVKNLEERVTRAMDVMGMLGD
jgi:outer membrane biosynthesis protein TonB